MKKINIKIAFPSHIYLPFENNALLCICEKCLPPRNFGMWKKVLQRMTSLHTLVS